MRPFCRAHQADCTWPLHQETHAGPQLLADEAGSCCHTSKGLTKHLLMQAAATSLMLEGVSANAHTGCIQPSHRPTCCSLQSEHKLGIAVHISLPASAAASSPFTVEVLPGSQSTDLCRPASETYSRSMPYTQPTTF